MIKCPCCQSAVVKKIIYSKENCPVLNNVVYETEGEALNCVVGNVELMLCPECNFVFNCDFNKKLIFYNEDYDNSRIFSHVYVDYLDKLVRIYSQGIDKKAEILEIGCGQGDFLKKLCLVTDAKGFGYDNTYRGEDTYGDNVRFSKEYFDPSKCNKKFDMLILRHVLEHVPQPYSFLKGICDKKILSQAAKLWIEVPDFEWILDKGVFYDVTYEHCNYFFKQTLANLLSSIGFKVIDIKNTFEGQYILMEAIYTSDKIAKKKISPSSFSISNSINRFYNSKQTYENLIKKTDGVCIWGASGKGVIFLSELNDGVLKNVKYVIDINPQKQGKFLPVSAKKVMPPEILKEINTQLAVLLMNKIYEKEIKDKLKGLRIDSQAYTI